MLSNRKKRGEWNEKACGMDDTARKLSYQYPQLFPDDFIRCWALTTLWSRCSWL